MRMQDYRDHFKRTNREVAKATTLKQENEHEVKWNEEILRVQVPGLRPTSASAAHSTNKPDNASEYSSKAFQQELISSPANEQWRGSLYELKNLMRVRAHADGFRRPAVNSACRFVSVSSSESSESEQEYATPQQQESEEETEAMPIFFRDDRVLFHAKHRCFKGTVRRRIANSDFYNIRADNGSYFEAVLAMKIQLLDEQQEEPPYFHFVRGDKVLWIPDTVATKDLQLYTGNQCITTKKNKTSRRRRQSDDAEDPQTYKGKIVQVRSLSRYDLLLRTGRVVKRVPREQLRPQDVFAYVSPRR